MKLGCDELPLSTEEVEEKKSQKVLRKFKK